ncbi:hypothetical protein [Micromonospora sp. NPDC023633]|uniref:hypothetical protein n=1 Tax=Micromonospora sp. NPDC023633 TaxID=3154320 RepID=UPI0033E02A1A
MPGGVLAQQPTLIGVDDAIQVLEQPPLEQQHLLVHLGQGIALHEQFPQVSGDPPRLQAVERLVGEFDVAPGQALQQVRGRGGAAVPRRNPGQPGERVVHAGQQLGQGNQVGPDSARAVVEQLGDAAGGHARGAAAAGVQLAFLPALGAGV